ncbi:RNA exonuclease 1 homolog isoform X2 [Periophthalmus magnuspinnatus]|uniref:RNA exonuclease 1 homolog isoform X2 n=1 Tax=Periophthalmus magnuspinnatus TaxID=409849 RepID=UPI0024370196|nr:RNA exonuclease 1 homolog isoform X2 [Periophthalmus magnuspinnatus]
MLRSTGFFRGIDCPFYTDYSEGKGGKNGCNRPYCHFRHSQHRLLSYGAAEGKKKELPAAQKEQGYDPFNPEVVHPPEPQNEQAASGDINGALALVNRAIEEVRTQMEREKRKLSRIGDEPYDPSDNASLESTKPNTSHMTYDPGSYQMTSGDYNPSPGCSKYTLDTTTEEKNANSMEYVPTLMKKSTARTQNLSLSPTSPKYSNSTSTKSKYTLDNTKPSTDMEYDPLSNYSASIAGKSKKEEVVSGKTDGNKSSRVQISTEEYVVSVKKTPPASIDTKKYTISDSDGESSGTEYKPTSITNLQLKKDSSRTDIDVDWNKAKTRKECVQNALTQRNKQEVIDSTKLDHVKHKSSPQKRKLENDKVEKKTVKDLKKSNTVSCSKSSSGIDKTMVLKTSNHDTSKKENKSYGKKEGERSRDKIKTSKEGGKEERQSDLKVKSVDKVKTDSSNKHHRDTESGGSGSKKAKISDKEKSRHHRNGQLEGSKSLKDLDGKTSSSSRSSSSTNSKGTSSKDKIIKNSGSPRSLKKSGQKERSLSLSHADLFGDESPEEAEPIEVDDDDNEEEEMLVRKCAEAVKRRLNKRKASELTPSSSEDEADSAVSSKAAKDHVESLGIDLSSLQDDLDFESDPLEECLRIFNESNAVKKEDKGRQAKQASRDSDEEKGTDSTLTTLFPGQKKRVSHFVAKGNVEAPPKALVRPFKRPTAQEVCYQRMQLAQQQAAQLSAAVKASAQSQSPGVSGEKKRIAHRPNPSITANKTGAAKVKPDQSRVLSPSQTQPSVRGQTTAGILSKTSTTVQQRRVAHTPTLKSTSMRRPVIPTEFGAKVPTNIRQRYLNTFIDECVKFCASEEAAFQMALDEEKMVYERSSSKNIYLNVAVNTLKKLRSKSSPSPSPVSKPAALVSNRRAQSHEEVLGGRLAATTSFTVNRTGKQSQEKLSGATLYHKLKTYLMTEEQLQLHGYPRKDPEASGRVIIYNLPEKKATSTDPFTKVCCRCGTEYKVTSNGNCVRKEECTFHWGRLRRHKVSGGWETSYSCCSGAVGSLGCQVSKQHVQDGRKESLDGFVSTFSKPLPADGDAGVFALDCEMCYTKQGLELTRVTVINSELTVIYDTFVKPASKVVDYNTRFSGVTEEDLESVSITLRDVQAVLLNLFSAESILLGHSLESDLLALKLIHSSVVDTAIVFPHRLGLPYKRALRNLMADHLKRIIQDSVGGHDSSEDASACMELMIWKIKEDAKVKR